MTDKTIKVMLVMMIDSSCPLDYKSASSVPFYDHYDDCGDEKDEDEDCDNYWMTFFTVLIVMVITAQTLTLSYLPATGSTCISQSWQCDQCNRDR